MAANNLINPQNIENRAAKPLRLKTGVLLAIVLLLIKYVVPLIIPNDTGLMFGMIGGILGGVVVLAWWLFFSRAPRMDRWGALALLIVAMILTPRILHESIATGNMGLMFYLHAVPLVSLAFVIWAVAAHRSSQQFRTATLAATIVLACGVWALLRSDGITGSANAMFKWRWSPTPEETFLARLSDAAPTVVDPSDFVERASDWPGFRGADRDGVVRDVRIAADWSASPPVEIWRHPIGPGCSSFAVRGQVFYTQEQRGDHELVACYSLTTGEPVWRHVTDARFWDSHVGSGPRSTPTVSGDRVYALGATGILNAVDAYDGSLVWSRNAAQDTDSQIPTWGITGSPLVVDELVIVALQGNCAAYDVATGAPRWFGPKGGDSYSSPQLMTIDGVEQIVLMSEIGATAFAPNDGTLLWQYPWPGEDRIVQPVLTEDGDLLICGGGLDFCMRRLVVTRKNGSWTFQEKWTSKGLRPNHNDAVVHDGHIYGFAGAQLACIDIEAGTRKWQGARYAGFSILLADQGLLLVLTEKGEVALVEATPLKFNELAKIQAIEGRTWNHPTPAGDILLVRNAQEMAAFRLPPAEG